MPNFSQALLPAGCSSTPPNRRTAARAASKQPSSSPTARRLALGFGPPVAYLPHRSHGGCATTGQGPAYARASRFWSQGSTPSRPKYTPFVATKTAAITGCGP